MTLTDDQKLEMTETILKAMGSSTYREKNEVYRVEMLSGEEESYFLFRPFTDWNDAMRAADALGCANIEFECNCMSRDELEWECKLYPVESCDETIVTHPDRLTAFALALVEIAKAKLEEE